MARTQIKKELLEADGWQMAERPELTIAMFKKIENRNPINSDPEDTDIRLVLHRTFNIQQFAVLFATGAMLNFNPQCMEDLKAFEEMLDFYDCEY